MSAVQSAWMTKKHSASAMDKLGTDVCGSWRKGRDSLLPVLVECPCFTG